MPDKTDRLLAQMRRDAKPLFKSGTEELHLPNHSGDHSRGKVNTTPVNATDIANKAYVDSQAGGSVEIGDLPITGGSAGMQYTLNEAETSMELALASKYINARNTSGSTISKGAPVYISGWNAGQLAIEIDLADADNASAMPAVGLAYEDIPNNSNGRVIMLGNTVGIVDTSSFSVGDQIYVSTTPGTLTNTKPTGATEQIQKIGTVGRSHASAGQLTIVGAGRSNDVPNSIPYTKLASGTDGELITWDASGNIAAVSTGSSGQVLTSNGAGAAPTFQAAGGGDPPQSVHWTYAQSFTVVAGTWTRNINSGCYYCGFIENTTDAQNDSISFKRTFESGTYTIITHFHRTTASGIMHIYVDSTQIATVDMYGTSTNNIEDEQTGLTINASGAVTVELKAETKNGSSSAYNIRPYHIEFQRTGA